MQIAKNTLFATLNQWVEGSIPSGRTITPNWHGTIFNKCLFLLEWFSREMITNQTFADTVGGIQQSYITLN